MPWDPARDLLTMQERLESLFGRATLGWMPAVDLYETGDRYVLTIELPGVARDQIQIEVRDGVLAIRGERPPAGCPERFQQLERGQGTFARSFRFGQPVRDDAINADLVDGVLTVTVPKAAAVASHRVEVL